MAAPVSARATRQAPDARPSGRFLLRMPSELHSELARIADLRGTSLNQLVVRTLADAVGQDASSGGSANTGTHAPAAAPDPQSRRLMVVLLVANALAIGLAALAAAAILAVALLS